MRTLWQASRFKAVPVYSRKAQTEPQSHKLPDKASHMDVASESIYQCGVNLARSFLATITFFSCAYFGKPFLYGG